MRGRVVYPPDMGDQGGLGTVYTTADALPDPLPVEPMETLAAWLADATARRITDNPNAMALATVDPDGRPSVRMVLCKEVEVRGGSLTFHTNYRSRKGRAIDANPRAAVVFHWDALERQARVEGIVRRTSVSESEAYFATRHWQSRIGAWASRQSEPIASREELLARVAQVVIDQGIDLRPLIDAGPDERPEVRIPRPAHWGGLRLWADRVELWVGGAGRIHDRVQWSRRFEPGAWTDPAGADGEPPRAESGWSAIRLQP